MADHMDSDGGEKMNRKILLTVLALAAVLLAVPYIGMAHATTYTTINGTITVGPETAPLKTIPLGDGNYLYIFAITEYWTGDIVGAGSTTASYWFAHDIFITATSYTLLPDFTLNIFEVLTFHGTVLGQTGTWETAVYLHFDATHIYGNWVILGGRGGLAHLHGQGTISAPNYPVSYEYTGQVYFQR
jgi:hypothetical protein